MIQHVTEKECESKRDRENEVKHMSPIGTTDLL